MNKSKFIIKLISAVGAAAIATTCVAGSVGAVEPSRFLIRQEDGETISKIAEINQLVRGCLGDLNSILYNLSTRKLNKFGANVTNPKDQHKILWTKYEDYDEDDVLGRVEEFKTVLKKVDKFTLAGEAAVNKLLIKLKAIAASISQGKHICDSFKGEDEELFDEIKHTLGDTWKLSLSRLEQFFGFSRDIAEEYSNLRAVEKKIAQVKDSSNRKELEEMVEKCRKTCKETVPALNAEMNQAKIKSIRELVVAVDKKIDNAYKNNDNAAPPANLIKKENSGEEIQKKKNDLENKLKDAQNSLKKYDVECAKLNETIFNGKEKLKGLNEKLEKYAKVVGYSDIGSIEEAFAIRDQIENVENEIVKTKSQKEKLNNQKKSLEKNINDIKSQLEKLK